MQEQSPPQMDPEPEMGAAAAYDASPPLLRNPPPIPAETAQPSTLEMILQAQGGFRNEMEANTRRQDEIKNNMEKKMDGMTQTMREEMQCMGAGLQDGLDKVKKGQEQLKGEIENTRTVEQFKIGQGELLRATCWGRLVEVTEEVTVTQWEELDGVTEYTETRDLGKIGERLHGVEEEGDAHTHTHTSSEGQWG